MNHGGHTHVMDRRGANGERYFKCLNYRSGCRGRLKCSDQGTVITRPHADTCRPGARPAANPRRDMFSPQSFRATTGGVRKRHEGYLYKLQTRRPNGNRYYCCANYGQGCPGRLKSTSAGTMVTQPHMLSCRPAATVPRPGNVDQRRMTLCVTPFDHSRAFRPVRRTSPTPGPSHQNDDSDSDEEVAMNDPFIQLQMDYLRQKMEIGELTKHKLQLEIQTLQRAARGRAGGTVAPPTGAPSHQNYVSVATSPTPAATAPPTGVQQRTTTTTPSLAAVGRSHFL